MTAYLDQNSQAARVFFKKVSNFVQNAKAWDEVVSYEIKPDEIVDATLISRRVYGTSDEFLTVMACAGLDSFDDTFKQGVLKLPNANQLEKLKRESGFESINSNRRDGRPRWSRK
ncbi:hypothetical protein [Acinetobacter proteolyticus]|uniref:Uncharacterized protein n=1 Tax=Acinetobacter proteolyticus TaxID=1776741 RepID=A0A2N0WIC6_9GAMM|nr:hypothetical protein [Acinetobacter proteolyticus]PKF35570.1 hypothetical protein CW311_04585 [Acinetobacter proteolyticus]